MERSTGAGGVRRLVLALLLLSLLSGVYGPRINDERDQATAMHALLKGSIFVHEVPDAFYETTTGWYQPYRFPGTAPVGSTLLDYLAVPMVIVLRLADAVAPLGAWTALATVALIWSFVPADRRGWVSTSALAVLFVGLARGFRAAEPDVSVYEAVLALQFTNVLLLTATGAFVFLAVRRVVSPWAAGLVTAAILAGQLAHWGTRLKYTTLAGLLVAIAIWLAGESRSVRRNVALGLVAGLAVWNNVGIGGVLAMAIGVWVLVDGLRASRVEGVRGSVRLLGASLVAVMFAALPWALENYYIHGSPVASSYVYGHNQGVPQTSVGVVERIFDEAIGASVWAGPRDFAENFLGAWTTGASIEGLPLGVFALAPLLALAVLTIIRRPWWRRPVDAMAVTILAFQVILLTNRVAMQGWGFDARLLAHVLPAVGVLAASWIAPSTQAWTAKERRVGWLAAVTWTLAGLAFYAAIVAANIIPYGFRVFSSTRVFLLAWVVVTAIVAVLLWLARKPLRMGHIDLAAITIGLSLASPFLWLIAVSFTPGIYVAGTDGTTHVESFVPGMDTVKSVLEPILMPDPGLPVVRENDYILYHPDFGWCDVEPSPCPWGSRGNATA